MLPAQSAQPAFDALAGTRMESAEYHAGLCRATQNMAHQLAGEKTALVQAGYRRDQVDDWVVNYAVTDELLSQYRQDLAEHCGDSK